jgi:hypothetical protein
MKRGWALLVPVVLLALAPPAGAERAAGGFSAGAHPVLHEPIPPDPREDVALSVSLDGELPAAIQTPRGLVAAPDPARPIGTGDAPYSSSPPGGVPQQAFRPDRDTRRPDVLPYDDPFSPSTAPFKRLSAFDSVDANYTLSVRDDHASPLAVSAVPAPSASEEQFYADMVVDLTAGARVRIPSVGPGARVLRARAGVGMADVRFELFRDGAENWFIQSDTSTRARLVMEISAPRAAFGGDFGDPTWAELLPVPPLPPNVERAATEVSAKIGVSRAKSPRDDVTKLVAYFRSFAESAEPPPPTRDIYLDLALSRKGVCRHRAFAFMVTALHLGIPTRMVVNEAHAWVEVHDGHLWRRIDLGGAGRTLHDPLSQNVPYEPPPDPFAWPHGSASGEDLADRARRPGANGGAPATSGSAGTPARAPAPAPGDSSSSSAHDPNAPPGDDGSSGASGGASGAGASGAGAGAGAGGAGDALSPGAPGGKGERDERPASQVTMSILDENAHRGAPFQIRGQIAADGEPCGHVTVEIVLRSRGRAEIPIGVLATDERGAYDGAIVLPATVPLGDYELAARTGGDARCGRGQTR